MAELEGNDSPLYGGGGSTGGTSTAPTIPVPTFGAAPTTGTGPTSGTGYAAPSAPSATSGTAALSPLRALLMRWQLPTSLASWLWGQLKSGVSFDEATLLLRERPEFKARFPGILPSMNPQDYIQAEDTYRAIGRQYGYLPNREQVGNWIKGQVSFEEAEFRLRAADTVYRNAEQFQAFNDVLKAAGHKPLKDSGEAFDFVTARVPSHQMYRIWEAASIRAASISADAGEYGVGPTGADILGRQTPGRITFEQAQDAFRKIVQEARFALPELRSYGVTNDMLRIAEFGGPGQVSAQLKIAQALKQRQAAGQPRAQTAIGLNQSGQIITQGFGSQPGA